MPRNPDLKKILMIGSGPIIIGQAAEFDYAGTQACKAIREEGIECVLVNSNPATIMTDHGIADKVYIEPLTGDALREIIETEKPDGLLAGFGGQTGLNLAMSLEADGVLAANNVSLLGVGLNSIKKAEDRDEFKQLMQSIGEPVARSVIATSLEECSEFVKEAGYPVIVRPAYTLGGTGGGFARDHEELAEIVASGLESSAIGQILLEESVAGWKEIEFEVMRDADDNCITICGMENFDPCGIHTGDSIVVAPIQTLSDEENLLLKTSALKIIRSLEIEGGCNIQFALKPNSKEYIVIEVNPRVSRSSALASKATGYPIAKIAAKIALGYDLSEIEKSEENEAGACYEPEIDYVVVKFPKWPFDKFKTAHRELGTQMKATGEVMALSNNFESALLKAVTSLEIKLDSLRLPFIMELSDRKLESKIAARDDERIFAIAEALRRAYGRDASPEAVARFSIDRLYELTQVDRWFLGRLKNIIDKETQLAEARGHLDRDLVTTLEYMGFTDNEIIALSGVSREILFDVRVYNDIFPVSKKVNTFGSASAAVAPYYYFCIDETDENVISDRRKILVVGSGPIRIGQGIEFDYCCVQGVWAIKDMGYEAIIINNNPETVSTDYETSDKLYFETLHIDDIMNVIKKERPEGVILQFGGQTSLNLAEDLSKRSINILGTSFENMDLAEDRQKLSELLDGLDIPTPPGRSVINVEQALAASNILGYPLVVRPSYVIGGRSMQVVYTDDELLEYLLEAVSLDDSHPVLIDRYIEGKEIEVDAIADGMDVLIPGIMEHIERTGVHSGDSCSVYPPHSLPDEICDRLVEYTQKITYALGVVGLVNIQYAWDGTDIYVIEVNPRASRTVPILSKVTEVPMVRLAVGAMLGEKLADSEWGTGLYRKMPFTSVKMPIFSNAKLTGVDTAVGPEMRSTGEILSIDDSYEKAVYKGFIATGVHIPTGGGVYVSLREPDKTDETAGMIRRYSDMGFAVYTSEGTGNFLRESGIECSDISNDEFFDKIMDGDIKIVINVPRQPGVSESESFKIRRFAAEHGVPVFTCPDTAEAFLIAITAKADGLSPCYRTMDEWIGARYTISPTS